MPGPIIVETGNDPHRPVVVLLGNQPRPAAVTLAGELVHNAEPVAEESPAPRVKRAYNRKPKPVDVDAAEKEQGES